MAKPKFLGVIAGVCAALILGFGCSTDTQTPTDSTQNGKSAAVSYIDGPYDIVLESVVDNGDGTWTWTWSMQNPNPGNGNGSTVQNRAAGVVPTPWDGSKCRAAAAQHLLKKGGGDGRLS